MISNNLVQFRHKRLIKSLHSVGENLKIFGDIRIIAPENVIIGSNVNLNSGCLINASSSHIIIGDNVTVSNDAKIIAASYNVAGFLQDGHRAHIESEVFINHDIWICAGAIILPGVHITGHHIVIGAGSVITKNINESYVKVVGNPGHIIR